MKIYGGFMSIPKFKRKPSGLDYADNVFELQKDIINFVINFCKLKIEKTIFFYNNLL